MARLKRLIFGCGYLGSRVARRWLAAGDEVVAVTRRPERAAEMEASGIVPLVADVTDPASLEDLPASDTILYAVGYDRHAPPPVEDVYTGGVRNVLAALEHEPQCFVYVSTTGVYGDATGAWVDERTLPAPRRAGASASLAAEEALLNSPLASRVVVLRMGGLYGPGRIPFLRQLRAGEPIPAPEEGWLNLIHIDDAAAVVTASAEDNRTRPLLLNVVDAEPVKRAEYYRQVARLLGRRAPRFEPPDPDSHRAARAATDRRISSARLFATLDLKLAYPNYRAGLKSILAGGAEMSANS